MQLSEVRYEDQVPVDGYGPGFFRVQDQVHDGAMFLTADGVAAWGGYDDLAPLIASVGSYDFVFIGTGADIAPLPKEVRDALDEAGVATEVMSSPSACRTYNIRNYPATPRLPYVRRFESVRGLFFRTV